MEQLCQVWYYESIDMKVFASSYFLQYILQRRFRYVKAFKKTIDFFMMFYKETPVTASNSPPPNYIGKNYGKQKGLGGPPA